MLSDLNLDFRVYWQIEISAGAELNEADSVALHDFVSLLNEGNNPAGDDTRDQSQADSRRRRIGCFKTKERVLVAIDALGPNGVHELNGCVLVQRNLACDWRVLDVNI